MNQVITASRLRDGAVVFRAADGTWVELIARAALYGDAEAVKDGLAASQQAEADNIVLDIYAIDVTAEGGAVTPVRLREAIRAAGPTVHPEHGKAASARPA